MTSTSDMETPPGLAGPQGRDGIKTDGGVNAISGHPIVKRALALNAERPHDSTLEILDAAMAGQHGTHPDFGWCLSLNVSQLDPREGCASLAGSCLSVPASQT